MFRILGSLGLFCALALVLGSAAAEAENKSKRKSKPPVPFTEDLLSDPVRIAAGDEIWKEQCTHCHGSKAYPGKAPKLKPAKYKPDFVYRRVTDGFRKMPPWDEVYDDQERMNVTIYILSNKFSP